MFPSTSSAMEVRKPDMEMRIGETNIRIYAPAPMTEEERKMKHQAVVKAVARCYKTAREPHQSSP